MQWGEEQLEIIGHRRGNLLVSAAAGAGKTTVLVERIVQMVLDQENGTDLDRMLVVTFTNLAAGQMKERIAQRLTAELREHPEQERLKKQLALLPQCSIMTIHAFCLQIVRRYIARIPELDPGFRVGDETETALLALDVLQEVVAKAYDEYDADPKCAASEEFESMVEQFSGKRQDLNLEPTLYRIYQFMQSLPDPWGWLETAVDSEDGPLKKPYAGVLRILRNFHKAFMEEKCSRGIVDYNDFEHYAQRILLEGDAPSAAAREVAAGYDAIFIDEYQDSNEIQERILNSIAKKDVDGQTENIFMVGDVKQSIYGFRYARPQLFMQKLKDYHEHSAPKKVFLQKNYRSRSEILEAVNSIFESLMQEACGGIEYSAEQALRAGRPAPESEADMEEFRPELVVLCLTEGTTGDKTELEAEYAAARIEEMLRHAWKYAVRDGDEFRPLRAGDIAILLRSAKEAGPVYQRALERRNIPASAAVSNRFFDTPEIRLVLNLLRIIDNALQDIPLEGVLHSPLFGFSSEELAQIRTETDGSLTFYEAMERYSQEGQDMLLASRIREFYGKLEIWREWNESLAVHELLLKLYRTTGLYEYVGAMKGGTRRRANLDLLLTRAEAFEQGIYSGVFQFLRFIDRMKEKDRDYEEAAELAGQDAVQVLTIHKSKGLEFPVVFLCGMGKRFQMRDSQGSLLLHPEMGLGCRYLDPETMVEYETEHYKRIQQEKARETLAEEMRVLYVALTRAKDRLIVTGNGPAELIQMPEEEQAYRMEPEQVWKAKSYMDWLYEIVTQKGGSRWRVRMENYQAETPEETSKSAEVREEAELWSEEELDQKLLWRYPGEWRNHLPMLLSVSSLKRPHTEEETVSSEIPWEDLLQKESPDTDSVTIYRGTHGGTLFHEVIARAELSKLSSGSGIKEELDRLETQGILNRTERESFPMEWLEKFTASTLYKRMTDSPRLLREEPFMYGYTPEELHKDAPDYEIPEQADNRETIVVQGVMDAIFLENGAWILVDYKTDRFFPKTVMEMYRRQLTIYAHALESMTGLPVREKILYQVRGGKEYFV